MATQKIELDLGRPTLFDEPLDVRKPIMFTASQVAKVNRACSGKTDFSTFVRAAVLEKLTKPADGVQVESVKEALRAVLEEKKSGQLSIPFEEIQVEKLDEVARQIGFIEGAGLLKSLALRAIADPGAAQQLLFGATERAFEAEARIELAERGKSATKAPNKKAA